MIDQKNVSDKTVYDCVLVNGCYRDINILQKLDLI